MVKVDEAFELRYKKKDAQLEVLVDFDTLTSFKKKPEEISVYDVLADVKIYKDQRRGEVASENLLAEIFGKKSEEEILKEILLNGEPQIPTSYLNKLREEKKVQVINYICENAMNPAAKSKYTPTMIEGEVNKLKYNFDPHRGFESQAEDVLKILKKVMPISIERVSLQVEIPPQYSGAFYGQFRKFGNITKEFYDKNSNLHIHIEISESQTDKVIDYIKRHTNNEASYHVAKH